MASASSKVETGTELAALRGEIASMRSDMQKLELAVHAKNPVAKKSNLVVALESWWQRMREKWGDTNLVVGGTIGIHTLAYWGFGLTMLALDSRLQKWKLQPGKAPTKEMYKRLLLRVLGNQGIVLLLAAVARRFKVVQDHCSANASVPIPSPTRMIAEVAFHFVVNDIAFYFAHGLLHTPYFYKRIHKIHHEFKAPIALAAEYSHILEYLFSNVVPGAIGPHLLNSHPIVNWIWLCMGITMTCFHHGGYVIPYYPFNEWALLHDYHHYSFYSNLGVTGLMDKALGTDGGTDYTAWRKEIIKRVKIANSFLFWKHPISEWLQVW